jgi:hypothetical protein
MICGENESRCSAWFASSVRRVAVHNRERAQTTGNTIARSSRKRPLRAFDGRDIHRLLSASHRCRNGHCPHNSKVSPVRGRGMQTANGGTDD